VQAEVERLVFEDSDPDTGFMLHPDMKWVGARSPCCHFVSLPCGFLSPVSNDALIAQDQKQLEALYCVAIVNR